MSFTVLNSGSISKSKTQISFINPLLFVYKFSDQEYWHRFGRQEIESALRRQVNWRPAKNVILLVGDGMDPNTVTAARIHLVKEEGKLSFERFPHLGLLKASEFQYFICFFKIRSHVE